MLKAYSLYLKDVQYVVQDNKVIIVDENTGRLMTGRRWSDGLHQAVEAKEGVEIERETQTLATITIQNYFRLYQKLAGMTGTAETEASEFFDIYKLGVAGHSRPTGPSRARTPTTRFTRPSARNTTRSSRKSRPSTRRAGPFWSAPFPSRSASMLSRMLKKAGIIHSVLNAKYHQQEAEIVARAGQRGAVTIATNMAGRGTDIKLGDGRGRAGRLARHRHRTPRIAAH